MKLTAPGEPLAWVIFGVVIATMLALDLGVFHRKAHAVRASSSDLLSISTRRYAGVYDSRASTSASASMMASGDTDDFYNRDLWR